VYRLTAQDTFLPPVTQLRGITFDGTRFWLMRGDHNALEHTLVEWDPSSTQTSRSFTYENLIEVAGTGVYGVGWDGSTVWMSVSGNTNKLVQAQPDDGAILRTLAGPSVLGPPTSSSSTARSG
jgi:hypothetical protein